MMPVLPSIATCARLPAISCCQRRLSNGIEAFISRMTAAGPSANRPPHMLLELFVRLLIEMLLITGLMLLAGCDSGSAPKGQVPPDTAASDSGKPADIGLESSNGLKAVLSYAFAGTQASDVVFVGADGRDVQLENFTGRPLLVNVWATWCGPCKVEMPTLDALAVLEEGKVSVIAISQDLEGRAPVQAFFKQAGIANLEPYSDPENRISMALGSNIGLPTTILYDSSGKEVWRVLGGVEWDDAEMKKLLNEAD